MPKKACKVAISSPGELYRAVEGVRRKSGRSRSALVQDALRQWLRRQAGSLLIRDYEAGYRRRPEGRREGGAAAAGRLFSIERWLWDAAAAGWASSPPRPGDAPCT